MEFNKSSGYQLISYKEPSWNEKMKKFITLFIRFILLVVAIVSLYFSVVFTINLYILYGKLSSKNQSILLENDLNTNNLPALGELVTPLFFELNIDFIQGTGILVVFTISTGVLIYFTFCLAPFFWKFNIYGLLNVVLISFGISFIYILSGALNSSQFSTIIGLLSAIALSLQLSFFIRNSTKRSH